MVIKYCALSNRIKRISTLRLSCSCSVFRVHFFSSSHSISLSLSFPPIQDDNLNPSVIYLPKVLRNCLFRFDLENLLLFLFFFLLLPKLKGKEEVPSYSLLGTKHTRSTHGEISNTCTDRTDSFALRSYKRQKVRKSISEAIPESP